MPRSVYGPPAGEEEKAKLAKLREAEEAEEAEAAEAEVPDAEAESRKRKLDELEQKKKALQKENAKKQREIEEEEKRIRAVEEAGRRAKEQRAKQTPKVSVPMEKENWFEKKAIEHGEEQAKNRLYILVKQKTTKPEAPKWYQPWWNQQLRAVRSLKEESRSLDRFGDLQESANLPKRRKAQNGESVCTRMNGKLDVPSG